VQHVAHMGEMRNVFNILDRKCKGEEGPLGDHDLNGRVILMHILEEYCYDAN